ncbi:MAG: exo-alpha-sialidase [Planctomycetota bacterium]
MKNKLWIGTRKGLFLMQRDGSGKWGMEQNWFLGDPVSMVAPEADGKRVDAALDLGHFGVKMQRSLDCGATWSETTTPSYPAKPEGVVDKDPGRGIDLPWSNKLVWAYSKGAPGELWCGTLPGGLFHSSDDGESWELVRSLWDDPRRQKWFGGGYDFAAIHSILVDPRDSQHVTIGVSVGGVWTTHDGGKSWELIGEGLRAAYMPEELMRDPLSQDPHCIVQCAANPDAMWMQHHNGIFRSIDGGVHWDEVENVAPSSFGFAVAVHPTDPQTAWFVPAVKDEQRVPVDARVVVNRTRDGGKTFETLHQGLPQPPAYDLVYRHALDIDASGDVLAFGSTTGSLWVSEDQGDSWQAISKHLPPILCVRFQGE